MPAVSVPPMLDSSNCASWTYRGTDTPLSSTEKRGQTGQQLRPADVTSERLLVFVSWYDGLSFQDGHFVINDVMDGEDASYKLSSFGYNGASRPPNHHGRLDWAEESIRRQAVEESWGLDLPDAVFVIVLHNRRRAMLRHNEYMKLSVPELFPNVRATELEDLENRADRLGFKASTYGHAHLVGETVESVLSRMHTGAPGFSRDTYRRALAYGTFMIQGNRDAEKRRREELIESARSANLLNGVFALLYFNYCKLAYHRLV